ncbi:hypothetical protein WJX72_002913 [[Myrmecia] bisecta]|uniref:Uncharacterized protein n=1 Tax=[Myrmecia] bisecta TaxID=41462 RepID=A0AAW1PK54_9CHLO
MAWGSGATSGVSDWVGKLKRNDPSFTSLHVFQFRSFGPQEQQEICAALQGNTTLTELYCSGHDMSTETAQIFGKMLQSNSSLTSLCVGNASFGDQGVAALIAGLGPQSAIAKLDLENKGIGDSGLMDVCAAASHAPSITHLILSRNNITLAGMEGLGRQLTNLSQLDLRDCQVGPQGCAVLADLLAAKSSNLKELWLSGNPLGAEGAAALATGLSCNQRLQILHMAMTQIGNPGIASLASVLADATGLNHLDVSECGIGPDGAKALGAELPASKLQTLILAGNALADHGADFLGRALAQCRGLAVLDVSSNGITQVGLLALCARASHLQKLRLFDSRLGDKGASALCMLLTSGRLPALRELDLSANAIGAVALQEVLAGVQAGHGPQLMVLLLGANPAVEDDSFESRVQALRAARPGLDVAWKASDPGSGLPAGSDAV